MLKYANLILIGLFLPVILVFLYLGRGLMYIFVFEHQDTEILTKLRVSAKELIEYKKQHGYLPDTLKEANIRNKACFGFSCFQFRYKVSDDRLFFKLAANAHYPYVVYFGSTQELREYPSDCCFGLAYDPNYQARDSVWPIYKNNPNYFATPYAWPDLPPRSLVELFWWRYMTFINSLVEPTFLFKITPGRWNRSYT